MRGCSGQGEELGAGVVRVEQAWCARLPLLPAKDPFTGAVSAHPVLTLGSVCTACPHKPSPSILQLLGRHSSVFEGTQDKAHPPQKPL